MTEQELFDHYKTVYAFIRTERGWRQRVFRNNPPELRRKLAECDAAEQSLAAIKNLAKSALPQQAALISNPDERRNNGYK